MGDKHPIHTTLSTDAMRILERYEKELGSKNTVLERALMGMDKLRFKEKIDTQSISRIIKRVPTGVLGFDELAEGGIPEGFIVEVTGPPATGKTTFSMQFLREGMKNNERCVFFSFEEESGQIIRRASCFGWDIVEYIDKGYLEIFGLSRPSLGEISEVIEIFKPKRVVLDPLNILVGSNSMKDLRISSEWRGLVREIKDKGIVCFVVTEAKYGTESREFDEFNFASDAVIRLDKTLNISTGLEKYIFYLQKMRLTRTPEGKSPLHNIILHPQKGLVLNGNAKLLEKIDPKTKKNTEEKPRPELVEKKDEKDGPKIRAEELKKGGQEIPAEVFAAIYRQE